MGLAMLATQERIIRNPLSYSIFRNREFPSKMTSKLLINRFRLLITSKTIPRASSLIASPPFRFLYRFNSSPGSPSSSCVDSSTSANIADVSGVVDSVALAPAAATASVVTPVIPTLLQPRVVVYDGVCHLCHRGVKWVIRADKYKKIKFCCLQSKAAEPYLRACGLNREDVSRRFLFIEDHGFYSQASTAALRVLSYLPPPYSALSALLIIPTPIRDAVYDQVAKRRYDWFGKAEDCLVLQEKELLERFIDWEELIDKHDKHFS